MGLKPVLRTTTSSSALTLLVGSFDPKKTFPEMTYNVFNGTLNPAESKLSAHASPQPKRHLSRFSRLCTDDRGVSIVYNGLTVSPSKLSFPMLASGPDVIRGSLGPPESGTQMVT